MIKQLLLLFCLIFLPLFGAPYHKRVTQSEKKSLPTMYRKKKSQGIRCVLKVEGVECGLCAQSVIDILNGIDGVEGAEFKNVGLDYLESFVEFFWTKQQENIAFDELQKKIEKEGFDFVFLEGTFYGSFENNGQSKSTLLLNTINIPVILKNASGKIFKKKDLTLSGKISYEKKRGYIFTLS